MPLAVRDELRRELTVAGDACEGDLIATARAFVASPLPEPASAPPPPPPVPEPETPTVTTAGERASLEDERTALDSELGLLQHEHDEHDRELGCYEAELARLDGFRDADVDALDAQELTLALDDLVDAYRRGDVLAGRLPLVLDGALDGLTAAGRTAAAATLAAADDVQAIVVTDDPLLAEAIGAAGGAVISWHELSAGGLPVGLPDGSGDVAQDTPPPAPGRSTSARCTRRASRSNPVASAPARVASTASCMCSARRNCGASAARWPCRRVGRVGARAVRRRGA